MSREDWANVGLAAAAMALVVGAAAVMTGALIAYNAWAVWYVWNAAMPQLPLAYKGAVVLVLAVSLFRRRDYTKQEDAQTDWMKVAADLVWPLLVVGVTAWLL